MADKKKKKKRSSAELHRQVQDSLQALPYVIEDQKKKGHPVKAFVIRYLSGPILRIMNRALNAGRYRGTEGEKQRQTDQMKRHLEQRKMAMKQFQTHIQQEQKRAAMRHVQSQMQQQRRQRPR
jgi:hypothetical protein